MESCASDSISVSGIDKSYGAVHALKGLSFGVGRGELFGLIGPDGAGKTTLFRILASLLLADAGSASIEGLDVVRDYVQLREQIGYMPGRFSLYPDLTVEENLRFFATIFHTTVEANYRLVEPIYRPIEVFKTRRAGKLSGGMKQKLALSCALIHKPAVLLLDEPTTGVDPVSRKEFWEMLRRLKAEGITILVSTPYMDEAGFCDRIALMREGELLSVATPQEIVAQFPKKLYRTAATPATAQAPAPLQALREDPAVESVFMFGAYLHVTFGNDAAPSEAFTEIAPSIEDCFIYLMNRS
jgi:ABC-type multidrug transport system ATPase subunit